jgi:hypothetical protein
MPKGLETRSKAMSRQVRARKTAYKQKTLTLGRSKMSFLYKFLGEAVADVLINKEGNFGIKFSHLSDYNDPYEFFLTIDYNVEPDMLSTYKDAISMIVKSPATCFAQSPVILPMWAHYAGNSNGFALEIDETALSDFLKELTDDDYSFGDIYYQNEPREGMGQTLAMATRRCKPRDMYFLYRAITSAAYYTKTSDWSYERERRLVIGEKYTKEISGNLILFAPKHCIKSLIVGQRANTQLKEKIKNLAKEVDCRSLEIVIGKSSVTPYFKDEAGNSLVFDGTSITPTSTICKKCKEPTKSEAGLCSWCATTEHDENSAASRNAFRIFHRAGILDDYVAGMDGITFNKTT